MPTKSEFETAFERIEDIIVRLGDSIEERHRDTVAVDNEQVEYRIIFANEDTYDCTYIVTSREDRELFSLVYEFDLIGVLADTIETEEGKELFEVDDFTSLDARDAARKVMNRVSDDDLNRLKFQLYNHLLNPRTFAEVKETDEGGIHGFVVTRHVFPYEEDFSLSTFYDALVAVVSTGEKGTRYLSNSFAIQVPGGRETGYSMTFDPNEIF